MPHIYLRFMSLLYVTHMHVTHMQGHDPRMCNLCVIHVPHIDESCHCETLKTITCVVHPRRVWFTSNNWMRNIVTHIDESCHTFAWVMSHVWMHSVTHMHESCHTHMNESLHTQRRHVWRTWDREFRVMMHESYMCDMRCMILFELLVVPCNNKRWDISSSRLKYNSHASSLETLSFFIPHLPSHITHMYPSYDAYKYVTHITLANN